MIVIPCNHEIKFKFLFILFYTGQQCSFRKGKKAAFPYIIYKPSGRNISHEKLIDLSQYFVLQSQHNKPKINLPLLSSHTSLSILNLILAMRRGYTHGLGGEFLLKCINSSLQAREGGSTYCMRLLLSLRQYPGNLDRPSHVWEAQASIKYLDKAVE